MISGIIPVSSVFNPFCYACACVTASLSGVFRMNRLQMLLRIQAETQGLGLCVFMWKSERDSEWASEWLTPDTCVALRGTGRGHAASLAGHYQCVMQWHDGYFLWDKTHNTHQLLFLSHWGVPIQANRLGDQLGTNWQSPAINMPLVAWLQKCHNGCGT